jgi:hypothetical protein
MFENGVVPSYVTFHPRFLICDRRPDSTRALGPRSTPGRACSPSLAFEQHENSREEAYLSCALGSSAHSPEREYWGPHLNGHPTTWQSRFSTCMTKWNGGLTATVGGSFRNLCTYVGALCPSTIPPPPIRRGEVLNVLRVILRAMNDMLMS